MFSGRQNMEVKQVFKTYNAQDQPPQDKYKYCAVCGGPCTTEKENGTRRSICSKCGNIHYENPYPAVSVLVIDDSNVLLCRRSAHTFQGGKWCLPCGFIEFDEDYLTAAIKEVKEETGFEVQIESIISVVSNFHKSDLHTVVIVLLARPVGGQLCTGDQENDQVQWFPIKGKLPEMAFEADTHIIRRFFETNLVGAPVDRSYANP